MFQNSVLRYCLIHSGVSRSLSSNSKNTLVVLTQQNTIRNVHRTMIHFQGARKDGGISHILQSKNKTKAAPASTTTTNSKMSTKEQEEIDELQALLEDEEILTPQRKKTTVQTPSSTKSATSKSQPQTPPSTKAAQAGASAFGAAASSSKFAEQMGFEEKEMQQMLQDMGLKGRWDQYKDMLDSMEEGKLKGASENWDEADMDHETKKAYKMFGENYLKSLKNEFDKPALFDFIKTQADGKTGFDMSNLANMVGAVGATSASSQASSRTASNAQQQHTTQHPATNTTQASPNSSSASSTRKKKQITSDDFNMNLDFDANTVAQDFENPEMRKALKDMFGAKTDEDLDKFKDSMMKVLNEGKSLKSLEAEIEAQVKELDAIFSFGKDLKNGRPSKKKK
ncbi:hypothetical protein C9374_008950 [Naegleria lovaniensis]|uniref:Uncharacterized protein n=1 Tax=Naegleria lovaniensis TaxID=51637 RepID=A0AA88GIT7_NAELO|nr:uncharacterized protein C9374_008950 [Naegleria lovaniensis]KAG2377865.1 hypothetical protein C9374_008950 [Naegleria lovaniensis]